MNLSIDKILQNSFVITINEDRFNAFSTEFKKHGFTTLPQKFIGFEVSDRYLLNTFRPIANLVNSPLRGELEHNLSKMHSICNSASHFAIVQHALLQGLPFVAIFEDDAVPVPGCIEKLYEFCSNIPDDTDILRLGYLKSIRQMNCKGHARSNVVSNHFVIENYLGSHAYVVFSKHYMRFLETSKDHPKCDYERINPSPDKIVYALEESLFDQINIMDAPVMHSYKFADGRMKFPKVT